MLEKCSSVLIHKSATLQPCCGKTRSLIRIDSDFLLLVNECIIVYHYLDFESNLHLYECYIS